MKKDIEKEKLLKMKNKLEREFAKVAKSKKGSKIDFASWLRSIAEKEKKIKAEVLDDKKLVEMSKKLKREFTKVAAHETGKGGKFSFHLREIMWKEIARSKKSRKK